MRTERMIGGRACCLYGDAQASDVLIQAVDAHDLEALDQEIGHLNALAAGRPFLLAAFRISDWNRELSPWEAPAVFGREAFGAGAKDTLAYVRDALLPALARDDPAGGRKRYHLGGYSLAGLFALWAAYQTGLFQGIAAVSPSVWFPQWTRFIEEHTIQSPYVYLSLGDREERTRNRVMAEVGGKIRKQHEALCREEAVRACTLEWNPGNHFADSGIRTAKGFAWLLRQDQPSSAL